MMQSPLSVRILLNPRRFFYSSLSLKNPRKTRRTMSDQPPTGNNRKKAVSIGLADGELSASQLASPNIKSSGSYIYNSGSITGPEAGVNPNQPGVIFSGSNILARSSSGSNSQHRSRLSESAIAPSDFIPEIVNETTNMDSGAAFTVPSISTSLNDSVNPRRQRTFSVMTVSQLEQMDAFASESVDNLKLVLPDIFERINDMLTSYPDMYEEVWTCLNGLLQEHAKRAQVSGGNVVRPKHPMPEKRPITFTNMHGDQVEDDFSYFTDRENESVLAYIDAEREYSNKALEHTQVLQKVLYQEFISRTDENESGPYTTLSDGFTYYSKRIEGEEFQLHCRKDVNGIEHVYLDENELYRQFDCPVFFNVGFVHHSWDLTKICYGIDLMGNERYSVYFKDISSGNVLPEHLAEVSDSGCHFSNDGQYAFYLVLDDTERAWNLKRHKLGTAVEEDASLIEELDEMFFLTLTRSGNGRFIFVNGSAQITSQTWYIYADYPLEPPKVVFERAKHVNYVVRTHGNHFYILTNQGVKNNYVFRVPIPERLGNDPVSLAGAEIIVEHRDFVLIESFQVRARHLVILERSNCLQNVRVMDLGASGVFDSYHYVSFSELVYSVWLGTIADEAWDLSKQALYETSILRFTYSSFIQPKQVIDYDMESRTAKVVYEQKVRLGLTDGEETDFRSDLYVQKRLFATGNDGTAIPISLVYRKDLVRRDTDSCNPCLLYSYGAYGVCVSPIFNANRLSLLDRGFIYALAHVRGGSDMGNAWYLEGKLDKKPNTFDDFISCAEFLVKEGYTSPEKLAIYGRSAGGLLIGAVVNKRPDLFKAVLTEVPFLDVINTMFDSSIPWVAFEYEEWGNPADTKIYNVMKTYCPYSNVKQQYYPNMLVIAGMNDPRVAYFEPAKWVAKLRHHIPADSDKVLILRVQEGGHGGSSGQYSHLEELAYEYAFLISCLNAPFKPLAGPGSAVAQLYKKIERDEFARNYLNPETNGAPSKSNAKDSIDPKEGKDGKAKYRKAQSQLYQWITNLF